MGWGSSVCVSGGGGGNHFATITFDTVASCNRCLDCCKSAGKLQLILSCDQDAPGLGPQFASLEGRQ